MQSRRHLVAALALALLGLVPATAPASAAQPLAATTSGATATLAPASARVTRLTAKIVTRQRNRLFLTGIVRPKKGPIVIQRATSCNRRKGTCNFKDYARSTLDRSGRYSLRVFAPSTGSWAWRAVKGGRSSEVWLTCTKRPRDTCSLP